MILLFFGNLIYQIHPARTRAPLGIPDIKLRYYIVGEMVGSPLLVGPWRSSRQLCYMMRYLVSTLLVLWSFLTVL